MAAGAVILEDALAESETLASGLEQTSRVAERVSGKVRKLDLSQNHITETITRISAIVDRTTCLDGVQAALENEDFESACGYVETFLALEAKYGSSIAGGDSGTQSSSLLENKKQLEVVIRQKFQSSVEKKDHKV